MKWFRVAAGGLQYRGRVSDEAYSAWVKTAEGAAALDGRVRQDRLRLFPRLRARRRIWRELALAARSSPLREAIQQGADRFPTVLVQASHAPGLPRRSLALHRLVIVPRALVAGRLRKLVRGCLHDAGSLAAVDTRVCDFFCEQLVIELDRALADFEPSPSRPFLTNEEWGCVGRDDGYQWMDPIFAGPGWNGHLIMFEIPQQGLARKTRKDLERAVEDLQASLARISPLQRQDIMRIACDGLATAIA